jgi:hypothetical protein
MARSGKIKGMATSTSGKGSQMLAHAGKPSPNAPSPLMALAKKDYGKRKKADAVVQFSYPGFAPTGTTGED